MAEEVKKIDGMFMENLQEWVLEEDKVVTYKYLSRSLKCHVNVAKQMLFNFIQDQREKSGSDLGIVYLLSGNQAVDGMKKLKVVLVEEKDLEKEVEKFDNLLSKHIYSVQKNQKISATALYATDLLSMKEDVYSCNSQSAIKNKAAVPKPNYTVMRAPEVKKEVKHEIKKEIKKEEPKKEPKKEESAKKETKKNDIAAAFAKTKKSPNKDDSGKKPAPVKKSGSNIASMFAKQASKPKKVEEKPKTPDVSPGKENMENKIIEKHIEETKKKEDKKEEKKSSAKKPVAKASKKKPGKDEGKKRKRITVASDSESDEEEKEEEKEAMEEDVEEEAPPQARMIESSDEEDIPSTPQPQASSKPGRRRVRKEVDKTYVDEKGYMVTKKEVEFVSEDEEEEESKPEPKTKKSPKKTSPAAQKPAAKKAKIATAAAGSGNKQANIMSFFKKK